MRGPIADFFNEAINSQTINLEFGGGWLHNESECKIQAIVWVTDWMGKVEEEVWSDPVDITITRSETAYLPAYNAEYDEQEGKILYSKANLGNEKVKREIRQAFLTGGVDLLFESPNQTDLDVEKVGYSTDAMMDYIDDHKLAGQNNLYLCAIQQFYEEDQYGNKYDSNIWAASATDQDRPTKVGSLFAYDLIQSFDY